jgi:hypothetical protein
MWFVMRPTFAIRPAEWNVNDEYLGSVQFAARVRYVAGSCSDDCARSTSILYEQKCTGISPRLAKNLYHRLSNRGLMTATIPPATPMGSTVSVPDATRTVAHHPTRSVPLMSTRSAIDRHPTSRVRMTPVLQLVAVGQR